MLNKKINSLHKVKNCPYIFETTDNLATREALPVKHINEYKLTYYI